MTVLALSFACGDDGVSGETSTPTYTIGGTVTKSDGGAAIGASVQLLKAADGTLAGQTAADAMGVYAFSGIATDAYEIVFALDGYATQTVSGVVVQNADIGGKDAVLQKIVAPTYAISGTITKSDGGAAAGATVKLLKAADKTITGQAVLADAAGVYAIVSIPAGEYLLVATLDGYRAAADSNIVITTANLTGKNIVLHKQDENTGAVSIYFNGSAATVTNPYASEGIVITADGANISVASSSTLQNIEYVVKGSAANGSLTIQSATDIQLTLSGAQITATALPAIQITSDITATITLNSTSMLADGAANTKNAALISKGALLFGGYGSLTVRGNAKHAISSSRDIRMESGAITVPAALSDGFHSEGFTMNGGSLTIAAGGDAIDAGGETVIIGGGNIDISSATDDTKGIKTDGNLVIDGGEVVMTVSGKQSKGLSSKKDIAINGGTIAVTTSGATVLEPSGSGYDPSYCSAVKADGTVAITAGKLDIICKATANGGKGISADGDITITGGEIEISTAGDGATYTNASGTIDSYSSACIKSDAGISLLGGKISCSSSGKGGKGISADGALTIGKTGAADGNLTITASTSGQKFLVSGSTGGGGRPGQGGMDDNADYANPKVIKSEGNLTVNSGSLRLTGTTDGGEGLESKATLTINGGTLDIRTVDDCLNAATLLQINGGTLYCRATGNDAIDSNGSIQITGGTIVAHGSEDSLDSDNTAIQITGGTIIGVAGQSMGSNFTGTQGYARISVAANSQIGVKNAANEWFLLYQVPASTSGGMGGGKGSTSILLSSPKLVKGASYTLYTGGTISDGTNFNGYHIGGSYSGGTATTIKAN
jgi:hypothetical protein